MSKLDLRPIQVLIERTLMKRYFWSGISRDERIKAISEITGIVNKFATILSFQKFSDISLGLLLETEECKLAELRTGLQKVVSLGDTEGELTDSKAGCIVHLNITFTEGTGDLEIEVPDIPE